MGHWDEIRRRAREWHAAARAECGGQATAAGLLDAAERLTGVARVALRPGDPLLDGADALLDSAAGVVLFAAGGPPWRTAVYQAHEYAHLWLDGDRAACHDADMDVAADEEPATPGDARVEGYGPHERREREASTFALEFLLPGPTLRRWHHDEGLSATVIAARSGLPESLVLQQLSHALLLPEPPGRAMEGAPRPAEAATLALDTSQSRAARALSGPLLVEAGPGTGKTRTLVGRILFLLEQGIPASRMLALTFSQRAAEEMRARVAEVAPSAAAALWAGTFHAFGLEMLRKYGTRLGLPPTPGLLDPIDAVFWLEQRLPALDLRHYQTLHDPAVALRDLLAAISRAKDEVVSPAGYRALAATMAAAAGDDGAREAAERALEVARVYALYQEWLQAGGLLDFGDLIARAVTLLREHPDVRGAVRQAYTHVLVDEYQDVNRASGLLLREIAGAGEGLWVVGDARQAIYRFRGAAPANVRLFAVDFPGAATLALARNYRSQPPIVAAVAEAAPRMSAAAGASFTPWQAARSDEDGAVCLEVAGDDEAELDGLARAIAGEHARGRPFADQAVLCRSHGTLARVAGGLRQRGVPVLYLGGLCDQPAVRDMLALLSLACEGHGTALPRVARFAEYAVPEADVLALLEAAREQGVPFPRALDLAGAAGLSAAGRRGLAALAGHLEGLVHGTSAWLMLARYLFSRSAYLRTATMQDRLALHQLLQVARERRGTPPQGEGEDPKRTFLRSVRRLEALGEETAPRQAPGWAAEIPAVRLLTIHAAKGLEFGAVYLPVLAQRYFPAPRRREPCPPPPGLLAASRPTGGQGEEDEHREEEECLFFVAISRARDMLRLSHARRYGRQNSRPSSLLALLGEHLPGAKDGPLTVPPPVATRAAEAESPTAGPRPLFEAEHLELYLSCPRRFHYQHRLHLPTHGGDDAYTLLGRCVRDVVGWLHEQEQAGQRPDPAAAGEHLATVWGERGPHGHPHEDLYRRTAEAMVARAATLPQPREGLLATRWEVELARGRVAVRPDRVLAAEGEPPGTIVVQRLRTGRAETERGERLAALYQAGAEQAHPSATVRVQTVSLATGDVEETALGHKAVTTRLSHYERAMLGILQGQFAPQPDDRRCPRCPFYFVCPS